MAEDENRIGNGQMAQSWKATGEAEEEEDEEGGGGGEEENSDKIEF